MKMIQIRKRLGITQAELASRCKSTQQSIARIEKGLVDPRLSTLRRIAHALGCQLPELFYSQSEFLNQVNGVIKELKLNLKKIGMTELNDICALEKCIPAYHPFWEKIMISNNNAKLKED